jgi:PAS domain S-box-containing protein
MTLHDLKTGEAAAFLAAIIDSSDDAIVSKTLDGIITSWNRGAEEMFGYSAAEAIGQHITLIIPPERHAEEANILARLRRGEKIDHFETVRQTKDGRKLDISLTVSPIKDSQGRIVGAAKVARDVTLRTQAYEERERLAAIIDSSDDAIVSKTLDGVITSWNHGAEQMFGYSAAEAIGQHITLIIPPERHAEEADVLAHLRRGEKVDHFETVRQTKDGRKLDISLTVSPIKDAQGRIIGASKVARDITLQKRADEERERLMAREEAARRTAEEASRLKDDFLAMVSHELRNPLNSIVGWAGILRSGKLDEKTVARAVDAILRGAQAQDQIISDLLDISRIVNGRLRLDIRPMQLIEVLESAIDAVRPAAEAKQIQLQALLDPKAGPLAGDPDRLRQVFWNLLSNAVKFTSKNGRVQIVSQRIDSHVEVVVSDTGIGIEPELLPFVFDRFRQGNSSSNRQSSGLGLGLAIVRNLVELHGGTVRVESKGRGQGASFTVRLPTIIAFDARDEERVHPAAEEITPAEAAPSLMNVKVLVVDDETGAREVASTILAHAEAEVRSAASAKEALQIMDQWQPDVLVADIGMPDVDGYEFIRQVRARSPQSGGAVPAAALTAYARIQDRLRVLAAGYQMHVPKPIQPTELVTVVASLAKRLGHML